MKSAVILAGGKSTRMGFDKRKAKFRGKSLIYWSYKALKEIVDEVILSVAYDGEIPELESDFGKRVIIVGDDKPDMGPIYGILTSFKKVQNEYVAVIPCDSPFIKTELYIKLFELAQGFDGAVPMINEYWEPLHAVYRREAMLQAIDKTFAEGKRSISNTYKYMRIKELSENEIKDFDPMLLSFININSKKDLEVASKISL
jgi:molybdopterin-guanine dinucleotide biosynthesis protein A